MYKRNKSIMLKIVFALMMLLCNVAFAHQNEPQILNIDWKSSHYMKLDEKITRLAVGNPEVATVVQVPGSPNEFLIVAHEPGATTLFVWTASNAMHKYLINVSPEDNGQARMIQQAIGLPDVHVKKVGNRILLTGTVRNQYERNYAVQIARLYIGKGSESSLSTVSGLDTSMQTQNSVTGGGVVITSSTIGDGKIQSNGEVIDLLHMVHPTQIRLEAQVIAIRPQDRKSLGIQYGNDPLNAPGIFTITGQNTSGNFLRHGSWQYSPIGIGINALVTSNRARILSRPSITTMSGEEAVIQVGGEIPYQTQNSNGVSNTEFKDYGIILQLKPIADAEDRITSTIHAEVSNMSGETANGQPILEVRRADSVVTVRSGSTMVIGGLMDSSERKVITKFPFLGNIPIIGEFFKYTAKTRDKQELIILVTPYIVEEEELSQAQMSDSMKDFYEKGQIEKNNLNNVDLNDLPENDGEPFAPTE